MNAEFDQGEADPTDPCADPAGAAAAGPRTGAADGAGTGVLTGPRPAWSLRTGT
ncbi:MAG TPA: hypothetical protein VGX23_07230 [Actinocrinis sp.]|nr:hypothetical protein [Actinocrinis sp.]